MTDAVIDWDLQLPMFLNSDSEKKRETKRQTIVYAKQKY